MEPHEIRYLFTCVDRSRNRGVQLGASTWNHSRRQSSGHTTLFFATTKVRSQRDTYVSFLLTSLKSTQITHISGKEHSKPSRLQYRRHHEWQARSSPTESLHLTSIRTSASTHAQSNIEDTARTFRPLVLSFLILLTDVVGLKIMTTYETPLGTEHWEPTIPCAGPDLTWQNIDDITDEFNSA